MRFALLAATAALTFAAPVQAAEVIQTGSMSVNGANQIAKFDPRWGTLQGIFVKQIFYVAGNADIRGTGGPTDWNARYVSNISTIFGGCAACNTTQYYATLPTGSGGLSPSLTRTIETQYANEALLTGAGMFNLTLFGNAGVYLEQASGPKAAFVTENVRAHFGSINYTVTYVYDGSTGTINAPGAVPEPPTWAMMIAGFGLVGGSMRRRVKASPPKRQRPARERS